MTIIIEETEFNYFINYCKKKNMQLDISPEGIITVFAPLKTGIPDIEAFLKSNRKKLLTLKKKQENTRYITSHKEYEEDENFFYLGKVCTLKEILDFEKTGSENLSKDEIVTIVKKFYTKQTKNILSKRIKHFENIIGVHAKSFTVTESPGTWGTCNSLKELTFNYRLSMAPPASIDYVIIHELCHIMHMNHDRSFWRKVGTYDKDYKLHQSFLEKYGPFFSL